MSAYRIGVMSVLEGSDRRSMAISGHGSMPRRGRPTVPLAIRHFKRLERVHPLSLIRPPRALLGQCLTRCNKRFRI